MNSPIIVSLGGSIVVPDEVDTLFIKNFIACIKERVSAGERFVITVGGGKTCRKYQASAAELGANHEEWDWIGIYTTQFNAQFMRVLFGALAAPFIVIDPADATGLTHSVIVAAGWKPGHSTDFDAILHAKSTGAKRIVNLSNIDYAYDKDPKKFPDAKKIERISWSEFRKIIPEKWEPGLNAPFDPTAAREAEE